jgi:hypothetical protein
MTIEDLAAELSNGFHDARVHAISVDYDARIAEFTVDVWVGEMKESPFPPSK